MIHGIKSYFGGLGDSLQFSTLPEMFSEKNEDVYLVKNSLFRNDDIKNLVWKDNPYIKGESDVNWDLGDIEGRPYQNVFDDFIKNWEYIHGLTPKNSFPKIYYTPKYIENIDVLVDINSVTMTHNTNSLSEHINRLITERYGQLKVTSITSQKHNLIGNFKSNIINVKNLYEYVDIINSCKVYISVLSGQHMLASSIRHINSNFKQICFIPATDYNCSCRRGDDLYEYSMKTKLYILPIVEYVRI